MQDLHPRQRQADGLHDGCQPTAAAAAGAPAAHFDRPPFRVPPRIHISGSSAQQRGGSGTGAAMPMLWHRVGPASPLPRPQHSGSEAPSLRHAVAGEERRAAMPRRPPGRLSAVIGTRGRLRLDVAVATAVAAATAEGPRIRRRRLRGHVPLGANGGLQVIRICLQVWMFVKEGATAILVCCGCLVVVPRV